MNFNNFFSSRGSLQNPPECFKILGKGINEDVVSLALGSPNSETVPIESISFKIKNCNNSFEIDINDLEESLQYSLPSGLKKLNIFLKKLQARTHQIDDFDKRYDLVVSSGAQGGISTVIECLLNEGDTILTEDNVHFGTLLFFKPLNLKFIGLECDEFGLIPERLNNVLKNWDYQQKFPKLIYLIPTGGNPTGCTMSNERKQDIYNICEKYSIIILEDDPYYYLQYNTLNFNNIEKNSTIKLNDSFLKIDKKGLVVRLDSLSKIISPGIRLGFITANKEFCQRFKLFLHSCILQTSGISQVIVQKILEQWGFEGWDKQINYLQNFYMSRRNFFIKSLDTHLKGLIEYNIPNSGFFVWVKILNIDDSNKIVSECTKNNLLILPGIEFSVTSIEKSPYIRLSFSCVPEQEIDPSLQKLSNIIKSITIN